MRESNSVRSKELLYQCTKPFANYKQNTPLLILQMLFTHKMQWGWCMFAFKLPLHCIKVCYKEVKWFGCVFHFWKKCPEMTKFEFSES